GVTAVRSSSNPSGAIAVSWNSVSGASGYNVYHSTTSSGTYSLVGSAAGISYTDTGLSPSATYYYKVSAYNDYGESSLSSSYASASTSGVAPSAPSGVTAAAEEAEWGAPVTIRIRWSQVSNANGYKLYRATSSSGVYTLVNDLSTSTSYTDYELQQDTTYYYKVSAYNSYGESPRSSPASAKTLLLLSFDEWRENTLASGAVHYYTYAFNGTSAGTRSYRIYWEDYDYDSSYGNITLSARDDKGITFLNPTDAGHSGESVPVPGSAHYVTIIVQGHDASSSGSYRIKFSY
ncbi:MAG: hypothetical protein LBF60_06725, partial [Treponema sp.]|nr:hypothetical protein [Treponema sp.]